MIYDVFLRRSFLVHPRLTITLRRKTRTRLFITSIIRRPFIGRFIERAKNLQRVFTVHRWRPRARRRRDSKTREPRAIGAQGGGEYNYPTVERRREIARSRQRRNVATRTRLMNEQKRAAPLSRSVASRVRVRGASCGGRRGGGRRKRERKSGRVRWRRWLAAT